MQTTVAIPALPPDMIEVYDPITKRFLFRISLSRKVIECFHRGVRSEVNLEKLAANPKDPTAVTTGRYGG
ncbi:MAG: hypothetical protein ACRYFS_11880 [Janthinobacterium lividum]